MAIKALYFSYIYKLKRIFIVFNSPKTVKIYPFFFILFLLPEKKIIILNYR